MTTYPMLLLAVTLAPRVSLLADKGEPPWPGQYKVAPIRGGGVAVHHGRA